MADEKDLTLNLRLRKDDAERSNREFRDSHRRLTKEMLSDTEVAERAKAQLIGRANRERIKAAADAAKAEKDASEAGVAGLTAMGAASAAMTLGLSKALQVAGQLGQAVAEAGEKSKRLTAGFSSERDRLTELAGLMERPADSKFTLDIARYNAATGFRPDEGRGYLTQLYNAAAQYKGKTISAGEFNQYAEQSGKMSLALGVKADDVASMAGSVLGFTNFSAKYGDQASEQALGMAYQAMKVMQSGEGENSVMARQYKMLAAGALSEDVLKGTFQSPTDVAIATSIGAEKHDAQAAELALIATRALRDPSDKAKAFREKMKIGLDTPFLTAVEKMAPAVRAMAEARGEGFKVKDVFTEEGFSIHEAEALAVYANKAHLIARRREEAAKYEGPAPALAAIADYEGGERGKLRSAQADVALREAERGAENTRVEILRQQALAELISKKQIDTSGANIANYLKGWVGFGALGSGEAQLIDTAASGILNRRRRPGMAPDPIGEIWNFSSTAREETLNRRMDRIAAGGVDPLADVAATNRELLEAEKRRDREPRPTVPLHARPTARVGRGLGED